jgi:hypothetical protein
VTGSGLEAANIGIPFAGSSGPVPATILSRTASFVEAVVPIGALSGSVTVTSAGS